MESDQHKDLVKKIVSYVTGPKFEEFFPDNKKIMYDVERNIISFSPLVSRGDFIGQDADHRIYIIGEAKTEAHDLDNADSKKQLQNYLESSKYRTNFHLIYAVPDILFRDTRLNLNNVIKSTKAKGFTLHLITESERLYEVKKIS